ncbi:hypothetical protein RRG08_014260 [Elysia crispata]|uniref:Uncharacterized protein n=1 Tax=Elysia crispata TaxID=231223 RepID=A0AAE1EAM8_9GAST|nr:hypothetical protein RRG08_014260 [Elysia crispata]
MATQTSGKLVLIRPEPPQLVLAVNRGKWKTRCQLFLCGLTIQVITISVIYAKGHNSTYARRSLHASIKLDPVTYQGRKLMC